MPKLTNERLKGKYGFTGKKYKGLLEKIIGENQHNIATAVGRINESKIQKSFKRTGTKAVVPSINEVIKGKEDFIRLAKVSGKQVNGTLRDQLNKDLKNALKAFKTDTGKPAFVRRAGTTAGRMNPELVERFQKSISKIFNNYTFRGRKLGVPGNIETIATTEIRSAVSGIKEAYVDKTLEQNEGKLKVEKTWIQNRHLSKNPRDTHARMDGVTRLKKTPFRVPSPDGGFDLMDRPHDPKAPANQLIGCNCDADYTFVKIP